MARPQTRRGFSWLAMTSPQSTQARALLAASRPAHVEKLGRPPIEGVHVVITDAGREAISALQS
jgi:hypothetical protein